MWWKQDFEVDRVEEGWVESWQEGDIDTEQKMMEAKTTALAQLPEMGSVYSAQHHFTTRTICLRGFACGHCALPALRLLYKAVLSCLCRIEQWILYHPVIDHNQSIINLTTIRNQ